MEGPFWPLCTTTRAQSRDSASVVTLAWMLFIVVLVCTAAPTSSAPTSAWGPGSASLVKRGDSGGPPLGESRRAAHRSRNPLPDLNEPPRETSPGTSSPRHVAGTSASPRDAQLRAGIPDLNLNLVPTQPTAGNAMPHDTGDAAPGCAGSASAAAPTRGDASKAEMHWDRDQMYRLAGSCASWGQFLDQAKLRCVPTDSPLKRRPFITKNVTMRCKRVWRDTHPEDKVAKLISSQASEFMPLQIRSKLPRTQANLEWRHFAEAHGWDEFVLAPLVKKAKTPLEVTDAWHKYRDQLGLPGSQTHLQLNQYLARRAASLRRGNRPHISMGRAAVEARAAASAAVAAAFATPGTSSGISGMHATWEHGAPSGSKGPTTSTSAGSSRSRSS